MRSPLRHRAGWGASMPWSRLGRTRLRSLSVIPAVASAVACASAGTAPSMNRAIDAIVAALIGGWVAWWAGRADRWRVVWLATPGLALAAGPWALVGGFALVLSTWSLLVLHDRDRLTSTVAAAAALSTLFNLDTSSGPFASHTAVGLAAILPIVASRLRGSSGYRSGSRAPRVAIGLGMGALVLVALGAGAAAARDLRSARAHVDSGIAEIESGIDLVRRNDRDAGVRALRSAAERFERATALLDGPALRAASLVPGLAQNLHAVDVVTTSAGALARATADTTTAMPLDRVSTIPGTIDLAVVDVVGEQVDDLRDRTAAVVSSLARSRSDWLVPQLAEGIDDLLVDLGSGLRSLDRTSAVVSIAPDLLGAGGQRRYLMLFMNPAESRELGGFVAAYGELIADAGRIEYRAGGRVLDLADELAEIGPDPLSGNGLDPWFLSQSPQRFPQNWTGTIDFEQVADTASALWEAARPASPVDGVLVLDPRTLEQLVSVTGPIPVDGISSPVAAADVVDLIQQRQYLLFEGDQDRRREVVESLATSAVSTLTSRPLPRPDLLATRLGALVAERRLLLRTTGPSASVLDQLGVSGGLPEVDSDVLAVTSSNNRPSKIDGYIDRTIDYRAVLDSSTGAIESTLTVTLENTAVPSDLPDYVTGEAADGQPRGAAVITLGVYSGLDVTGVTVDGTSIPFGSTSKGALRRHAATIVVAPGATATVVVELQGSVDLTDGYEISLIPVATARPDSFALQVRDRFGNVIVQDIGGNP